MEIFEDWYRNKLKDGSLWFSIEAPGQNGKVETLSARMTEPYNMRDVGNLWLVQMKVELREND